MKPLLSIFKNEVTHYEENGLIRLWKSSILPRKTKVYAVDYAGRDFAVSASGEKIRNKEVSFLKSA